MNRVLREEKKFLISIDEFISLSHKLGNIMLSDPHNGTHGYTIRSLYFDTVYDRDYFEKQAGAELRRKIRLRCYDPKSDYAFKRFFGTVSNKELTIGFLNSLLNKDIKDIIFHNVEMQGNNTDSRKAVFDLFCEGSDGELFIVEIQKKRQKYFSDRVLYYASFVIQMRADIESENFRLAKEEERRRWNYHINKVYVVCFLDFRLDTRYTDKYRWDVVRMDRELKIPFSETLNEIYLELPKFNLNFEECDTFYKKFLYTMNNIDIMGQLSKETIQNDKLLRKLKSAIELQRMSAKERLAYELSIAAERDLAACMATSFEEGEEKGIAKGITEGMRKIILNMKQAGMDLATIAKTAGLPEKEVEALLK